MRHRFLFPAWLAGACLAGAAHAVAVGETAPDFDVPNASGAPVRLSDLRGKVVYLDFWASWCGPCRQSFPFMNDLQAHYGTKGLEVVAVNVDAHPEQAQRFLAEMPARFRVVFDPKGGTPRQYAIPGMPTSVLIDPQGKVVAVHNGFRAEDRARIEALVSHALTATAR